MKIATAILSLLVIALTAAPALLAQPGTVHRVQTFTYGSPSDAYFVLPSDTMRFEKILMHYKLRCPFDGPCGEWDYLMYIHLFDHTGIIDSVADTVANFTVNDTQPDSLAFMWRPSWRYTPRLMYAITYTDTASLVVGTIDTGSPSTPSPLFPGNGYPVRAYYLWHASELSNAGLTAGLISAIRLNQISMGGDVRNLTIRMKATNADSLTLSTSMDDAQRVYQHNATFASPGWKTFAFTSAFAWDGTLNIIVEITHDGATDEIPVVAGAPSFASGIISNTAATNSYLHFEGSDYIDVPTGAFNGIDSAISIAFWARGNPAYQPQNQSIFEGLDSSGRRVLNMHLPWSDGQAYWDAGSGGSYDRANRAVDSSVYEGSWNHWVVTKNLRSRNMRIYLNGTSYTTSTSKTKPVGQVATFHIGSAGNGANNYDGDIDDFAVWDRVLDGNEIGALANGSASVKSTATESLRLYYAFDPTGSLSVVSDSSGNGYNGFASGLPGYHERSGQELATGWMATPDRPSIAFEQGIFTIRVDTTVVVDSVLADPLEVIIRDNPNDPATPTDTLIVWPAYYNRYAFDKLGNATDSATVEPDSTIYRILRHYYRKFERIDRYEIGRYITPYGNGLSLGDGFTWTYDVSDYATLLHDTVHLSAYNQQELVDVTFEFVEGTPPRDPVSIQNIWVGSPAYGTATSIEEFLSAKQITPDSNATDYRLKMRTTGHGFGGTENCAEFCPKHHSFKVDGVTRFDSVVWKEDCGSNPVYPQGGTWVYNRSNWCPGDIVPTYDFELTPYVTPGEPFMLDYDVENYTWNGAGSTPYYRIETQIVGYSAPNFTLDASVELIKSPSTTDLYRRMNPICSGPVITIKNTGSTPLTRTTITYGIVGGTPSVYEWNGNLGFTESADVRLGEFAWSGGVQNFYVEISNPNGAADEYAYNNRKESSYTFPPQYPSAIVVDLKTNNAGDQTSYEIRDVNGTVVHSRSGLLGATVYRDTLNLPEGCYEFHLIDLGGDGLDWWANRENVGSGYVRIRRADNNSTIKTFNPDFGAEVYQQFTVGYKLSDAPTLPGTPQTGFAAGRVEVHPNPTTGEINVNISLSERGDAAIAVRDLLGRIVADMPLKNVIDYSAVFDLGGQSSGVYVVTVTTAQGTTSRKVVVR